MSEFREHLRRCCQGRVCLVGLGNEDHGDDGFGLCLARKVEATAGRGGGGKTAAGVLAAGTNPERYVRRLLEGNWDQIIFLDAVDFGGDPGAVVLVDKSGMQTRFPQVSTHKISLGLLAGLIETNSRAKAWLLGVQPESLRPVRGLSAPLRVSLEILRAFLVEGLSGQAGSVVDDDLPPDAGRPPSEWPGRFPPPEPPNRLGR